MKKDQIENIKKIYQLKIEKFKEYNKLYYQDSNPVIDDREYDILKFEIIDLENKYSFLNKESSPTISVGYKPSKNFKKVKHKVAMLSLNNVFDRADLLNFEKKIFNFLSLKNDTDIKYSAEPKIDGISASLHYKNGHFIQGLSRGDGVEGEDITDNLNTIKDIPKDLKGKNIPSEIDIRG